MPGIEGVEGVGSEEAEENVDAEGWKGVNWMEYPFISRMSRYARTEATCCAGMWYAAPQTFSVDSCYRDVSW
jgi:hypothetical protein